MRNYKRKTERGSTLQDVMEMAMKEILIQKKPCGTIADKFNIPYVTLRRYCMKYRKQNLNQDTDSNENISLDMYGYSKNNMVFSNNQEINLVDYLLEALVLYYGLCTEEIRSLAYEYADQLGLNMPKTWSKKTSWQ